MKQIFKTLSVYVTAYVILLMVVVGLLCSYPKTELHLLLNSYHTNIQDTFFKYYSMLAEGPIYVLGLLPLLWKKIKLTVFFALCELSGGSVLQILKHTISTDRPISVFEHYHNMILPLVQGVDMHHSNSFPSGHASTFFVFCTCFAIFLAYRHKLKAHQNNRRAWVMVSIVMLSLFVFATLGAYSRIYLSQHFLSDVCTGSIIGFMTPCLIFYFGRHKILKLKTE
jgi:membrane-associated phospholipid phosphatase